jgi:hypothetical protein
MANLGADFNANTPTDADFVRHPTRPALPAQIRTVRSRFKSFFGELFDLETGDFKDAVIPQSALVDHPDKPDEGGGAGFRSVTVDSRGFVVSGEEQPTLTAPRHFRAFFSADGGSIESSGGVETTPAPTPQPWPDPWPDLSVLFTGFGFPDAYRYSFIVPEKVSRVVVTLQGGGSDIGKIDTPDLGQERTQRRTLNLPVEPGNKLWALVGAANSPSVILLESPRKYATSQGYKYGVVASGSSDNYATQRLKGPLRPYGRIGTVAVPSGVPGFVMIDWYA